MANLVSRTLVLALATILALSGCRPEGGEATLLNESGRDDLTLVIINTRERERTPQPLDDDGYFDTQFQDRELQCYVESDGRFEVRDPEGEVFVRHDFSDKPVCDGDVIVLGADGSLTWEE